MKKYINILFLVGWFVFFQPAFGVAQDEITQYAVEELKNFQKDLEKMGKRIDTASDVTKYETEFNARHQLVESWYNINSEIIFSDKDLQTKYIRYTSLYETIKKRIEEKKAEKTIVEKKQKLTIKLNGFLQDLTAMEEKGNRYVSSKRIDSLKFIKDKANDCLNMASMEYGKSQELIDDDDDLFAIWKSIKDTNTRISNLEVVKSPFNMTLLLEIMGVIAAIALIVTMITTIVKSAKIAKGAKLPKPKKPKKKEENLPSI